ncbi:hypothetical protein D3C76_1290050 [compost metagenome]
MLFLGYHCGNSLRTEVVKCLLRMLQVRLISRHSRRRTHSRRNVHQLLQRHCIMGDAVDRRLHIIPAHRELAVCICKDRIAVHQLAEVRQSKPSALPADQRAVRVFRIIAVRLYADKILFRVAVSRKGAAEYHSLIDVNRIHHHRRIRARIMPPDNQLT